MMQTIMPARDQECTRTHEHTACATHIYGRSCQLLAVFELDLRRYSSPGLLVLRIVGYDSNTKTPCIMQAEAAELASLLTLGICRIRTCSQLAAALGRHIHITSPVLSSELEAYCYDS